MGVGEKNVRTQTPTRPTPHTSAIRSRNQRTDLLHALRLPSLAALFLLAACGGDVQPGSGDAPPIAQTQDGAASSEASAADTGLVQVEDFQYARLAGDARVLTGEVYNPTDRLIKNVQVQVSLFDANNRRVSEMSIGVKDVPANGRRPFRQAIDSDLDVQGAKVRSLLVQ